MGKLKFAALASLLINGCQVDIDDPIISTCVDSDIKMTRLPDVPLVRQSEHLDFYSDGFVCAGTASELERHVAFVADSMGVNLRMGIPVVLSPDAPAECEGLLGPSTTISGCSKPDGTVFSTPESLYHELNHSVACQLRSGQPRVDALIEGFAVMHDPLPWASEKSEDLHLTEMFGDSTPPYPASGHFVRWLVEREGPETLADLYRTPSSPDELPNILEDLYGVPFVQLETEYGSTPWKWAPFRQCADLPHVDRDPDGVWRYSGPPMNCDDESTMGPFLRERNTPSNDWDLMYQSFTFTLGGAEGIYLDYALADGIYRVKFERCLDEHVQTSDDAPPLSAGFLIPKINGAQTFPSLCPGTWRANVLMLHDTPNTTQPTEVAIWHLTDPPVELPPLQACE